MIAAALLVACALGGVFLLTRAPQVRRLARLAAAGTLTRAVTLTGAAATARLDSGTARSIRSSGRVPAGTSAVDDLAFDLDLVAVCLQAGLPVDRALDHAVRASGDRSGLAHIARSTRLGLAGDTGGERTELSAVIAVIRFSSRTGVALAPLLQAHADELRRSEHRRRQIAAARLGVMLVMPLGVCVLPAFVLLGVVPVLLTLLGDLAPALTGQ
ncbi:Type II secretion system (T2SS), protein F [Brevibacterium sp. Mu109]|uniref:type II secretion system F family protein n=1 Tax=Brevibacterium sp. Mu109 TaxID=1255669 RepID=UPI000C5EB99B|nr:type II secretion system F family protein [Brevibacterium sp. Mu109]SMX64594.1 Type II secretion system (T2SS), protein F [Brevibacterium sp. Mu109]